MNNYIWIGIVAYLVIGVLMAARERNHTLTWHYPDRRQHQPPYWLVDALRGLLWLPHIIIRGATLP